MCANEEVTMSQHVDTSTTHCSKHNFQASERPRPEKQATPSRQHPSHRSTVLSRREQRPCRTHATKTHRHWQAAERFSANGHGRSHQPWLPQVAAAVFSRLPRVRCHRLHTASPYTQPDMSTLRCLNEYRQPQETINSQVFQGTLLQALELLH